MTVKIRKKLVATYPEIEELLTSCSSIDKLKPREVNVLEAVVKIVIGQMLSRHAAETIFQRVKCLMIKDPSLLSINPEDFYLCGVSKQKTKAIMLFSEKYSANSSRFDKWSSISFEELSKEVELIWGISTWTASMLAIFYFAFEDVFPYKDGTIQRALEKLKERGIFIKPELATPYRSYLALYLWKFIDDELI